MRFLVIAVIPVALLSAACDIRIDNNGVRSVGISEGRAEDVWTRSYTLPAGGTLEIIGRNGEIEVVGGGDRVEVRAEREVRADTDEAARALLTTLQVREEVLPTRVKVDTAGEQSGWGQPGPGNRTSAKVRYRVRVPAGLSLILRTENGAIHLDGVDGRVAAATTNGGISGEDFRGGLEAETTNGGIRLDFSAVGGDVRVSTTNGGVRLTMPRDVKVQFEASCVNGGINVDPEFGVEREEDEGRNTTLSAAVNGGGPTVTATTVNGGIRIRARGADSGE